MDSNERIARSWMLFAGVALIGAGLLGFIAGNPIASADPNALFRVNAAHNIVHIVTGVRPRGLAGGTPGGARAHRASRVGGPYAIVAVLLIVDPTFFGLFNDAPTNAADHVLHAALAIVSLALGYMARERTPGRAI